MARTEDRNLKLQTRSNLACFLVGLLIAATGCSDQKAASAAAPRPAVPVKVAKVEQRDMPVEVRAIGNVQAYATVQIKAQVNAQLEKVHFKEGEEVRKGQLLFTLDPRQIEADLARSQGDLAKDEAALNNAKVNLARGDQLVKEGVISRQQYDDLVAAERSAQSAVTADQAAVEGQRVQLSYTKLYSPIDGRTGSLLINAGNLIKANDTPFLVTINQLQPIYVTFSLPEKQLEQVRQSAQHSRLRVVANIAGDKNPVVGDLSFLDNSVDQTTGTIKLKASFANRDRRLWPGQFVDVSLTLATQHNALVIPSAAIQTGQNGQYVYVVKPDLTAENRNVSVARTAGDNAVVDKGLQAGEMVVTDGQVKLQPNAKVEIKQGTARAENVTDSYGIGD